MLKKAYDALKQGQFQTGIDIMQKAAVLDKQSLEIEQALQCALFWKQRKDKLTKMDHYSQSEYLMNEWNAFLHYTSELTNIAASCFYNIKYFIFTLALENYLKLADSKELLDFDSLLKIGRIYKELGNYETAIEILEHAHQSKRNDPKVLADLADCYAQVDEMKAAKLFFREAFFIDPAAVDISAIESPFFGALLEKIKQNGIKKSELTYWIPVFGTIYGIFNIKRELKPIEIGKLKQSISTLENSLLEKKEESGRIIPLLINKLFWLMDHYISIKAPQADIENLLLKIKNLDEKIYLKYIN
ncbi:MAG: tetratricopeptide repeat protein [Spirochaetales bacterium]|nr:tetratricopeptide repeat protein [Spirochaetales bacterium]